MFWWQHLPVVLKINFHRKGYSSMAQMQTVQPLSGIREGHDLWKLSYNQFEQKAEMLRETLCTVGNGYFGTRGCFESERAGVYHYPGTYIAGLYNRLASDVHGKEIFNDDFVNCPNWLLIELRIGSDDFLPLLSQQILDYDATLDMQKALFIRRIRIQDEKGRITRVESKRFASMANMHCAAISFSITPENYSSEITIRSSIDGSVENDGVARYRALNKKHLSFVEGGEFEDGIYLCVETNQSHVQIAMSAKHVLVTESAPVSVKRKKICKDCIASEEVSFKAKESNTYTLEKLVAICTSRDENTASAVDAVWALLPRMESFDEMFNPHVGAWEQLWDTTDIQIEGDRFVQQVIRLHIYHLLTTASHHNLHIDAGMPARGLHGEAYRGHIFWDSLFVMPFYFQRLPDVARAALMYRYRRLDAARNCARENGYEGAMFPWQSADEGQEETQVIHYNPMSGKWDPDFSCRQRHVSIAIFYNILEYINFTDDEEFLHHFGIEMLIEIARFWVSATHFDATDSRYHIFGIMGPDEFHEKYHDLDEPGIHDNAYTNVMVVWLLERTIEQLERIPQPVIDELRLKIGFERTETDGWKKIANKMYVPVNPEGIICQFAGYMDLLEVDWDAYRAKYDNIHRMDRILKSEGDSPDRYKVAKQADTLMLFYVLSPDEVIHILEKLGIEIGNTKKFLYRNYTYYEQRTSHGSTLSKVVHAAISRDMGTSEGMWKWFMEAVASDIHDTQGGTTIEGVHCGVMAGTINIITRVMAGIHFTKGKIDIKPSLPPHWKRLNFKLVLRGTNYRFDFTQENVSVHVDADGENPLTITLPNVRPQPKTEEILIPVEEEGEEINVSSLACAVCPSTENCGSRVSGKTASSKSS